MYYFMHQYFNKVQILNIFSKNDFFKYFITSNLNKNSQTIGLSSYYFFLFNQLFFSQLLKTPCTLMSFNSRDIIPKNLIYYAVHSAKLIRWKKFNIIHSNEIMETLFLCLWLKNIKLFMSWMLLYFEKASLKKHRKLFLLLNLLLGKLIWNYNIYLQLKGLRLVLRGKFGKAGSVRKTRKYIKKGVCSYTSKNVATTNQTNVIKTLTGVFSIKLEIFF